MNVFKFFTTAYDILIIVILNPLYDFSNERFMFEINSIDCFVSHQQIIPFHFVCLIIFS